MTTEQPNLQQLAKQGNPKAIAALLNRFLQPKGITAKAAVRNGCLQIMLEAAQVPPKQPYVDSLRKGLTNLMPTAIEKVRVYGKQVSEDVPEWLEEFDLSAQPIQDFSKLAKQGDVNAINILLNQLLNPHSISAKSKLKNDCLHIMLESAKIPNQQAMVELLNAEVSKLEIASIKTMKLFGKQTDEDFPDWHQEVYLTKLEIPSAQVEKLNTFVQTTQSTHQREKLASNLKIDLMKLSNQVYEILKTTLNEPFFRRDEEEEEKGIHEAVRDFIHNLDFDLKLATEQSVKELINLMNSLGLKLDPAKTNSHVGAIYESNFLKNNSTMKQLEEITNEVLGYNFSEEEDSLFNLDVATNAVWGFVSGGIIGSFAGGYSSWETKKKEQEEKQLLLERYKKNREKLLQEWQIIVQLIYEFYQQSLNDYFNLKLMNYQVLKRGD